MGPAAAARLVWSVMELLDQIVNRSDLVNATESAFLVYPQGFYRWAGRAREAVHIQVAGNEERSYAVMVVVTMDIRKVPLFTVVGGQRRGAKKGLALTTDGPRRSAWGQITETKLQCPLFF